MRKIFIIIFLFSTTYVHAQDAAIKYCNYISPDSIKTYLNILASDTLEGRETGYPGQKKAAAFLASKYKYWNLQEKGTIDSLRTEKKYLQEHTISLRGNKGRNLTVNGEYFLYGRDFIYGSVEKDTTFFLNKIMFIGGISESIINDNIRDMRHDISDVCILAKSENRDVYFNAVTGINHRPMVSTYFIIKDSSVIKNQFIAMFNPPVRASGVYAKKMEKDVFYITEKVAKAMLTPDKYEKAQKKSERKKGYVNEFDAEISLPMISNIDQLSGENVIAMIPGTDLSNETIILSSHYDHLGKRDTAWFPGADDNASGTSAILEMARVFTEAKKEGRGPRRNILFLNVSGEEKGLLGSSWFVDNPTVPLESVVANINIDMIGRTDSIHDSTGVRKYVYVIGADKISKQLSDINEAQNNKRTRLELDYKYNSDDDPNHFYRRSDHYNFAKKGIPVIFYFDGKHADYHLPSDTPDKIDYYILSERARLAFLTAWELANMDKRLVIDKPESDK